MNFYEHHIGDYAEATAHLTFVEDAAYSRLIRKYYSTEKPLPVDVKAVQRLVGARSKDEREAVEAILNEFFELRDDGWHNERCDFEIKNYLAGEPEREAKRANEQARLKNHRDERSRLFKELNEAGLHAPWNTGIKELREMVSKSRKGKTETPPATQPKTALPPLPATAPETPATATQIPLPTTHNPDSNSNNTHSTPEVISEPSMQGRVCVELQKLGIMHVNPCNPELLELIEKGISINDFIAAGVDAVNKSNFSFNYVIGIVRNRKQQALEKQKSQSNPSRLSPGFTNNNSRGNYDTNHGNNEAGQHSGRKLSLVEQAQRGIELIEARERREREQQASILA
jgi:uncharacterized protein YdaU (DUF1376 family)